MMKSSGVFAEHFEYIISSHFRLRNFLVDSGRTSDQGFDLKVTKGNTYYLELKFYRSNRIHYSLLERTVSQLAKLVGVMGGDNYGIAIFSIDISIDIRLTLKEKFGITIWDREIVLEELRKTSIELKEHFESSADCG